MISILCPSCLLCFCFPPTGAVKERVGTGREYVIEGSDGKSQVCESLHIFGAFTRKHPLAAGDRVLTVADKHHIHYLPGWITAAQDGQVDVNLCNGK